MARELLALQKKRVKQSINKNWRMDHLFRVEIEGQPEELILYVKDVAYGKGTIDSKSMEVGTGEFNLPSKKNAGSVTVTFYDDEAGTISAFITSLQKKIFNEDGTINLPVDYLFKIKIFRILQDASEFLEYEKSVYCEENNDYKGSVEAVNERGTFNATFKKFRSIGGYEQ